MFMLTIIAMLAALLNILNKAYLAVVVMMRNKRVNKHHRNAKCKKQYRYASFHAAIIVCKVIIFDLNAHQWFNNWFSQKAYICIKQLCTMFISSTPQVTLLIIHSIVFAIAIIYLIINRKNLKKRILRYEQQVLLSQMNPHFVFNSLTAIQSYIFRNEPHTASKYLASFAKLTRLILENSRAELCSIEREISTLKLYLDLQKLRFEGRFDYTITVDERIDPDTTLIPPMLAQPLIENAIEHGFSGINWAGRIEIRYTLSKPKYLVIEVEDNGIGIEKSHEVHVNKGKPYRSLATEITKERIKNLKKLGNSGIKLNITDKSILNSNVSGTIAQIVIPLK